MARFTTRVELHQATDKDYTNLHKYMSEEGFTRTITTDDGKTYRLPTAEYNRVVNKSKGEVLDDAKAAADRTGTEYKILVTESAGRTWHNLDDE